MLNWKKNGNIYKVKFNGKHSEYVTYLKSISFIYDKRYDVEEQCWILNQNSFNRLNKMCEEKNKELMPIISKNISKEKYIEIGKDLKLEPYEYQKEASYYSTVQNSCIYRLPCGAGKSFIGITNYHLAFLNRVLKNDKAMFIVKSTAKKQWLLEFDKFSDYEASSIQTLAILKRICSLKRKENRIKKLQSIFLPKTIKANYEILIDILNREDYQALFDIQFELTNIYIITYNNLNDKNINEKLHEKEVDFIYADEIHLIKSKDSIRTKKLVEFNSATVKSGATATVVKKNPEDIFSIFQFIKPDLFSSHSNFAKNYLVYAGFGQIVGGKNLDDLNKKISNYIFTKTDKEVSDQLPELVVIQKFAELNSKQQEKSDILLEELNELKDKEKQLRLSFNNEFEAKTSSELQKLSSLILAKQTFAQELTISEKLFELSSSNMSKEYITGEKDNRIELLIELLEEIIESGEKVVVFSRFEKVQQIIIDRINKERKKEIWKDVEIACISGKLDPNKRFIEYYDKFTVNDNYKILLCSDAGCESINLSGCKYLIELDIADSVLTQTQRRGRITRASSVHKTVFVYQTIVENSYDDIALKIVEKKKEYDKQILG